MSSLPTPLTPLDCDLRDFPFMPLDVVRLRDSDITAISTGDEFRCAVLLWCASWHQIPAASLPDDDIVLSQLSGFGRVVREWKKVREGALRGWIKCSDGRLYHPVVAEKANESHQSKLRYSYGKFCDRKRKAGVPREEIPSYEAWISGGMQESIIVVTKNNSSGNDSDFQRNEEGFPAENSLIGTGTGTGTGISINTTNTIPSSTNVGEICKALRNAGIQRCNPSHPKLREAVAAGATVQDFIEALPGWNERGVANPFAWLIAKVASIQQEKANGVNHAAKQPTATQRAATILAEALPPRPTHESEPNGGEIIDGTDLIHFIHPVG